MRFVLKIKDEVKYAKISRDKASLTELQKATIFNSDKELGLAVKLKIQRDLGLSMDEDFDKSFIILTEHGNKD